MSLSPVVSFQLRFVTYLLNFPRIKILKDIKLKITPTCFVLYAIHHQGV